MLAYCGRLLRALRRAHSRTRAWPRGLARARMRRTPRSAGFCAPFPYIDHRYARETIAETCSIWVALATAIISQTGS